MKPEHMKGALLFGLMAALVAGVAMVLTLHFGHDLDRDWWLAVASAGAAGLVGFVLGLIAHFLMRPG
jgi:hypothetical protein